MCACVCTYTEGIYIHVLLISLDRCIHSMQKKILGRLGMGRKKYFLLFFFLAAPSTFFCLFDVCFNFAPTSVKIITCELLYECAVSAKKKKGICTYSVFLAVRKTVTSWKK